jgi:hypothetical protein
VDHLYRRRALSYALNKHALRLLSVAGLRSGGCMGVHVCRDHDQEELEGYGEALFNESISVVTISHNVKGDVK